MVKTHMIESLKYYEEMLETLKANKDEISKGIKKIERTKKAIEKLGVDVNGLDLGDIQEDEKELEHIIKQIKMCKSIIRRYVSVLEMYEDGIVENEEVQSNLE